MPCYASTRYNIQPSHQRFPLFVGKPSRKHRPPQTSQREGEKEEEIQKENTRSARRKTTPAPRPAKARPGSASDPQDLHLVGEGDRDPLGVARRPLQLVHLLLGGVGQDGVLDRLGNRGRHARQVPDEGLAVVPSVERERRAYEGEGRRQKGNESGATGGPADQQQGGWGYRLASSGERTGAEQAAVKAEGAAEAGLSQSQRRSPAFICNIHTHHPLPNYHRETALTLCRCGKMSGVPTRWR